MKNNLTLTLFLCLSSCIIPAHGMEKKDLIPKAIQSSDVEKLKEVFNDFNEADLIKYANLPDQNGITPLMMAIDGNNEKMVELLLNNGSAMSINDTDKKNMTPLIRAIRKNNIKIVELLLQNKSLRNINIPDQSKVTPLHVVTNREESERVMLELLIKNGAIESINKTDCMEETPLSYSVHNNKEEMVKLLLHLGAKITDHIKDMLDPNLKLMPIFRLIFLNENIKALILGTKKLVDCCTTKELKELNQIKMNISSHYYDFLKFGSDNDLNFIYKNY